MTDQKKNNARWIVFGVLALMWLIGSLIGKSSTSDSTSTTDDTSYSVDDSGASEARQRVALQTAVDEFNRTSDMTICQAISVLGRSKAVDTIMDASDYVFDRTIVEDFMLNECP